MTRQDIKKLQEYWVKTAKRDYETMLGLFEIKRYPESLFFGHIVLEKILKAHVAKHIKKQAPKTHNLMQLMELAELNLPDDDKNLLDLVNIFNLRSRYPDYKLKFFKTYNKKEAAKEKIDKIKKLYNKLCQKLTLKK